jgi:hypothetical protein
VHTFKNKDDNEKYGPYSVHSFKEKGDYCGDEEDDGILIITDSKIVDEEFDDENDMTYFTPVSSASKRTRSKIKENNQHKTEKNEKYNLSYSSPIKTKASVVAKLFDDKKVDSVHKDKSKSPYSMTTIFNRHSVESYNHERKILANKFHYRSKSLGTYVSRSPPPIPTLNNIPRYVSINDLKSPPPPPTHLSLEERVEKLHNLRSFKDYNKNIQRIGESPPLVSMGESERESKSTSNVSNVLSQLKQPLSPSPPSKQSTRQQPAYIRSNSNFLIPVSDHYSVHSRSSSNGNISRTIAEHRFHRTSTEDEKNHLFVMNSYEDENTLNNYQQRRDHTSQDHRSKN